MTHLLEQAIERIRTLPPEIQDDLARVLMRLSGEETEQVYRFTSEEAADLDAAEEEVAEGDFASDAEVAALFAPRRR